MLLIIGCLLPIVAALVYSQINLHAERRDQLGTLVLRQAELANADLAGVVDGVRQLAAISAQAPDNGRTGEGCDQRLDALRHSFSRYQFLAFFDPSSQTTTCATQDAGNKAVATGQPVPEWLAELSGREETSIGRFVFPDGPTSGVMPIAVAVPAQSGGGIPTVFIAGLRLSWLSAHIQAVRSGLAGPASDARLYIADRDGRMIGYAGGSAEAVPDRLPSWLNPIIMQKNEGVTTLEGADSRTYIAGYVPSLVAPMGVTVIELLHEPMAMAGIDLATLRDVLVMAVAACGALAIVWIAGRRLIFNPTRTLMQAALRWRDGDFSARAEVDTNATEFAALAHSFNVMAERLEARETGRQAQASHLEAQVAERARELSETNNRLQVEIAGREKTEAALHQAHKLQAVGQLAGGIAHDFNNMLATVLGNLELMERRLTQAATAWGPADTDRLQKLIERATGAVQRGGQLTSRLLAFSRRQRLAARPTDINALLMDLITLASSTLGRRIRLQSDLAGDLWLAFVDPSQVETAILNLCLNARDAMREGGTLSISTSCAPIGPDSEWAGSDPDLPAGDYICIRVSDTGTGMAEDVKARAFEPFFTTKGPSAGSGLGLSQVYGMVRQSGGSVAIDSTLGAGTTVTLLLPRATDVADPDQVDPAPASTSTSPDLVRELVLVVDDDHAVRQVTVEMARDLGCEVVQASGGDEALAVLRGLPRAPRFILLDYAMPGMNGLQLARAIREQGLTAPIVLVTGYAELSDVDVSTGHLAGLLRKPFTIRELEALLRQLRGGAGSSAELESGLIQS
jgi:signal transduction histidine kinase/ActR/RegA family two-component response regulator